MPKISSWRPLHQCAVPAVQEPNIPQGRHCGTTLSSGRNPRENAGAKLNRQFQFVLFSFWERSRIQKNQYSLNFCGIGSNFKNCAATKKKRVFHKRIILLQKKRCSLHATRLGGMFVTVISCVPLVTAAHRTRTTLSSLVFFGISTSLNFSQVRVYLSSCY